MTFDEWWKNWSETIWKAGGLASPNQVKLLFEDAYREGYEQYQKIQEIEKMVLIQAKNGKKII